MAIDWDIAIGIGSPLLALVVGAGINHFVERRSRLVAYYGHVSSFMIRPENGNEPFQVFTHTVVIKNAGRLVAKNVRLHHAYFPSNHSVFPPVAHSVEALPDGSREIVLPAIVPGEEVTVSYLYPPITWNQINTRVKSDDGLARVIRVLPTRVYPKALSWLLLSLVRSGDRSVPGNFGGSGPAVTRWKVAME